MKKLFLALVAVFALSFTQTKAQNNIKIGYTNIDYILVNIPDSKDIEAKLKTEKGQYDKMLQDKITDFQTKLAVYEKGAATMSDVIRADKEKELQTLQASIEEFQRNSESSLQKKQQQLLQPVLEKIQNAITSVAKENNYTYVLNSDAGAGTTPILLHVPETDNITELVFKKLGVTPPVKATTTAPKK